MKVEEQWTNPFVNPPPQHPKNVLTSLYLI
jgi:hypothetical protein